MTETREWSASPVGGRPRTVRLTSERSRQRSVAMPDEVWEHCVRQPGGASEYLRRLVQADRRSEKEF
jgi:hypothetical protein